MSKKTFNIFQVAGIYKAEEIHTSIIAELINPQSEFHDNGAVFLDKFLRMEKVNLQLPFEEVKNAKVYTEFPTDQSRRIDMVISTKNYYLPFEVKIWAGDQKRQLEDYYKFMEKQGKEVPKVYYLTPDGHAPSEWSGDKDLLHEKICLLSFQEDIIPWLEACMESADGITSDVLEIMKQLHDNIQGQPVRPGVSDNRGFSQWNQDVLDILYWEFSQKPNFPWTECTDNYLTFTLAKKEPLEFALRIKKENVNKVRLYLICGLMGEDEKPDYNATWRYISKNPAEFETLLKDTFRKPNQIETKNVWDRLSDEVYCKRQNDETTLEFAKRCQAEISAFLDGLLMDDYKNALYTKGRE